jgi:hydroxymethylpyrimidine/phosphomethylpyrimidine kinase
MIRQGRALLALGPRAVLMKGGHLDGAEAVDLLVTTDGARRYAAPKIASPNTHGTGCALSSAIAAHVVLGLSLAEAVGAAKAFVMGAIERGATARLGAGPGPLMQAPLVASAAQGGLDRVR